MQMKEKIIAAGDESWVPLTTRIKEYFSAVETSQFTSNQKV
jgi:hypothetical protein